MKCLHAIYWIWLLVFGDSPSAAEAYRQRYMLGFVNRDGDPEPSDRARPPMPSGMYMRRPDTNGRHLFEHIANSLDWPAIDPTMIPMKED